MSVISRVINQSAQIMMPTALDILMEMSFQDARIGKIVGGIGLTVSGASLMVASGIPKTLKSRYWTNAQTNESTSKTALRWGTAAAGLIITSYGVYNITTGIFELIAPNPEQQDKTSDSKFPKNMISSTTCDADILNAKKQLLSCPEGQQIWDEVENEGPFTIRCATSDEAPAGSIVYIEKREILLSETKEMVKSLLFELTNLKRAEIASLVGRNKCGLNVEDYVVGTEAIEYGSVLDTHKIAENCIKGGFWSSELDQYQEEFSGKYSDTDWTSFEGYLATQEKYGHADFYRMQWYKKCNPQGLSKWIASNMDKWQAVSVKSENEA